MTVQEFVTKYENQTVDFDGKYGGQCVDLYRQYVKEVLDLPQSPPVTGAKDIFNSYLSDHFTRITNTPTGIPRNGDVVIWGSEVGQYGHVAIFLEGDTSSFLSFDQNWPVGSKCHQQLHDDNYKGVLGWLRPKQLPLTSEDELVLEKLKTYREKAGHSSLEGAIDYALGAVGTLPKVESDLTNARKEIASLKEQLSSFQEASAGLTAQYNELATKLAEYQKLELAWQKQTLTATELVDALTEEKNQNWMLYKNKNDEFNALKASISSPLMCLQLFIQSLKNGKDKRSS
jgi:hypothetical protein